MGESSQNEKLIFIQENETNENEIDIEEGGERGESENLQTKNSKVEEIGKQIMKKKLQQLHVQRKFWGRHNRNSLCWAFYCVNDGREAKATSHQVPRYILYYDSAINILNARTKKKGINNLL